MSYLRFNYLVIWFLLFCFNSLLMSPLAHAKDETSARQQAFKYSTQARTKYDAENYQEAIGLWRKAYDTYQDNKLLLFIASTYGKMKGTCESEQKAWSAYFSACKAQTCPNIDKGKKRQQNFKARCFITVKLESSTPDAIASYQGEVWGKLPLSKDLLMTDFNKVKISAPGYLSRLVSLKLSDPKLNTSTPTGHETSPVNQTSLNIPLTPIPPESFFEKHQLKIALSTAIVGVSLLSLGSLNFSGASALADQELEKEYPKAFETTDERRTFRSQYNKDKEKYESQQFVGGVMMTIGLATLGASVWMLLHQGENTQLHHKARLQGDLSSNRTEKSLLETTTFTFNPLTNDQKHINGFQGNLKIRF